MSSVSSDGGEEKKPSEVQLLIDVVNRQMQEAQQREARIARETQRGEDRLARETQQREDRLARETQQREDRLIQLLERLGPSSAQQSTGDGGVPAQREPLPAAPGQNLPSLTGHQGEDGDPAPRAPLPPGPAGYPSGHGGPIAPGRDPLAPDDHPSGGDGVADPDPALRAPLPPGPAGRPSGDSGAADPGPALRAPLPADLGPAGRAGGDSGAAGPGPVLRELQPPAPGHARSVSAGYRPVCGDRDDPDPDRSRSRLRLPAAATPAPRLIASASLREFEAWKNKFDGFRLLVGLNDLPRAEQRAALLALLDDDWVRVVRFGIPQSTDATIDEIILDMQHHLRRQRNIIIDRRDFNTRVQQQGETFDEFLCALRETVSFCDFCTYCIDDRLRDWLVVGARDEDARRRMLEQPDLTLQSAADICRAFESAVSSTSAIQQPVTSSLARMSRYQRDRRSSPTVTSPEKCARCGRAAHRDEQRCPAVERSCFHCQEQGHFAAVCRRRSAEPQTRDRSGSRRRQDRRSGSRVGSPVRVVQQVTVAPTLDVKRVPDVRVRGVSARCSPRVELQLHRPDGEGTATTYWTPDTGAETSAMSLRYAERFGIRRSNLTSPTTRLLSADSREMQCFGTCNLTLQLGRVQHTVEAVVVKMLNGPLLSWHDSIKLGILPENYPQQIQSVTAATADGDVAGPAAEEDANPEEADDDQSPPTPEVRVCREVKKTTQKVPPRWNPETAGEASRGVPPLNERQEHFRQMKAAFPRVFDASGPLREMAGGTMKIELTADAVPFAARAPRTIPFCWRDEVREQLDDMLKKEVIEPVNHPTAWCHPLVPVPKRSEDGAVSGCRLTVDFTRLNKFVKRPVHPVRSTHDAVASIGTEARFFTKLDAKAGYHQIPIREEDKDLTTFITPWGRFRFRRAAMGLVSSGDVYNQRGDQALGDVPRTCKVVDDVMAWDSDYNDHLRHVWNILARCEDNGITLNAKKCVFAAESVDFCGFTVGASGYTPDSKKTAAVSSFPQPECLTDLRSFLGLVHQMGAFSPDVARAAEPLRQLLRPKNSWLWTEEHSKAFNEVKMVLVKPPVLGFFNPKRRTVLETDAARLKGLGFCLRQQDEAGNWRLIQCGSRFLTDTETRYAVIEVEMLAIVWAMKKCAIYLQGMQNFEVATDHRPLIPILNGKSLQDIANPRLQRLRESIVSFNCVAVWRQGKLHAIPDALSRYPVEKPTEEDEVIGKEICQLSSMVINAVTSADEDGTAASPFEDTALSAVRAASERDPEILALREAVLCGFPDHKSETDPQVRPYWNMRDRLAVDGVLILCGQRIVVPTSLRRDVLQKLHASHQGEERTKRRARQVVYWPGIDRDISNVVKACQACRLHLPKQQKEPIIQMRLPTRVFEVVSVDFFEYGGRSYLVYADRLSGWPWVSHMGRTASAHQLTTSLRQAFASTGVPTCPACS